MMNIKKRLFSAMIAALTAASAISSFSSFAAETHIVKIFGYNGEPIAAITVPDGGTPDLSAYEESDQLNYFEDERTQIGFGQWDKSLVEIKEDMVIRALSVKMVIENSGDPKKTVYYSKKGTAILDGLKVTITKYTQVPDEKSKEGYKTETEVNDITKTCTTLPVTLDVAFAKGQTSYIQVIPPAGNKPIYSYTISLVKGFGDANGDGFVNAIDASKILSYYSDASTGTELQLSEEKIKQCDVNMDGVLDSSDASNILIYYAEDQTSDGNASWDSLFDLK